MMRTVVLTLFIFASVYCELKDYEEDRDAFLLAQKQSVATLLEPPKAVYEKIHRDLMAIRKAYPVVADIKHIPNGVPGRIICKEVEIKRLNESSFGPIRESSAFSYHTITFQRPYNSEELIKVLSNEKLANSCYPDHIIGASTQITLLPSNTYVFYKGSGDCPAGCINKTYWTFRVNNGKVTLVKRTGNGS